MKKSTSRGMILAALAGLAMSAAANAQYIVAPGSGTFTDISATGTIITAGDDSSVQMTSSVTNALVPNATFYVCTNGFMTSLLNGTFTNGTLPIAGETWGLFPFWDDLYVDGPGTLTHKSVVEGTINVEIIQWNQVRLYDGGAGTQTGTFEVKIFQTGPVLAQFIYPDVSWTNFPAHSNGISATIGAQFGASAFSQFSYNAASIQNGAVLSVTADTSTGACCKNDGTCVPGITAAACLAQSGVWQGANSACGNCPQPGACCLGGGACQFTVATNCTTIHGAFRGVGVTCAAAACPIQYSYDDGTAENAYGLNVAGSMAFANGFTSAAGADIITHIKIVFGCYAGLNGLPMTAAIWSDPNQDGNPADATRVTTLAGVVSGAGPFPITNPVTVDFDIADTLIPVGQKFFVGFWIDNFPAFNYPCAIDQGFQSNASWYGYVVGGSYNPDAWSNFGELFANGGVSGSFMIRADATGSAVACYANCDNSTILPCLNVIDFGCFLNKFAAGDTTANCDGSTITPVLNVLDFGCFLNKFAAGCSNC